MNCHRITERNLLRRQHYSLNTQDEAKHPLNRQH